MLSTSNSDLTPGQVRRGARRVVLGSVVTALVASSAMVLAPAASADPSPIGSRPASAVTADALPTTQIDGVAWSQAVVGNTVYVGGNFANARPAGAAAGTNLTPRANLLSYNLTTGVLNAGWNPGTNGDVRAVAASPDGSRIYIGGTFTQAGGANRYRIAAFDTATGNLISSFAPIMGSQVNALVATNTTVYAGGFFTTANGQQRNRLAAFSASNGALLGWAPSADYNVNALALTPDGSRVIVGGSFANINGGPVYGLGAIDAVTGAVLPWAANQSVQNAGKQAAITSLSTDGTAIYGTGYVFGAGGNLEGAFSADPDTGDIRWVEDCHGDTYSAYSDGTTVYTVSHAHYCSPVGGYPQTDQNWNINLHHALAFTAATTGTLGHNIYGSYKDWFGTPSPTMLNWFPDLKFGNYTAQGQAAWNVTGNGKYVVMGGEFPSVNGTGQQGLVRFATPSAAPNAQGPMVKNSAFVPNLVSLYPGSVRVSFPSNWDRDDQTLTYQVFRDGASTPVWTKTANSQFWNRPTIGFVDTGLAPGSTHSYRVFASDPGGNLVRGDTATITLPASGSSASAYDQKVLADGASSYWPLSESTGSTMVDYSGFNDLDATGAITRGATGPVSDGGTATTFDGSSASASTRTAVAGPDTFTVSSWVRTTSTQGGKIVGFGNTQTGASGSYDRHVYLDNSGRAVFGVYNNAVYTLSSPNPVNDGQWHQLVASLGPDGMAFYVDGVRVGRRADTTIGQQYSGYWRVGGDNIGGWPNQPASNNLAGDIADVAIFPSALSRATVRDEYTASGRSLNAPAPPTDTYGKAVTADDPDLYWRLDDASGPTAADASQNVSPGTYSGGVSYRTPSTVTGPNGTAVTFDGSTGTVASQQKYSSPGVYSEEAWFRTSTTHGGKIIGFGDRQSGYSGNYDRHVWMDNNGQINFGTWTGSANIASSSPGYNDGKWHQVVATQGSDGMKLYLDGQVVGTNPQTQAQSYDGYWRVGGDTSWSGDSSFFAGDIDEVAVYSDVLSPGRVLAHYTASPLSPNAAPVGSFTASCTVATCAVDGSASSDSDGSIAAYSWDFGDGGTATGATANHTYAVSGTYQIALTVTDDRGASTVVAKSVTVTVPPPNQAPSAAFTSSVSDLAVSFDGSGSSDPDGTVASYAWDFGDGSSGTGVSPKHTYDKAGSYSVTLTVTDDKGATNALSQTVVAVAPNQLPTASFTVAKNNLSASFDASASSDPDGTVASYAWDFGDGATGTGATASHAYAAAGTFTVTLTVTDNRGGKATTTRSVSVSPPNQAPTSAFTASVTNLAVAFDGTGSSDPDGTVAGYQWNFGDGTGTSTQAKPTYTYAAAGTYSVSLTVTDDRGATNTSTQSVTVAAAPGYALDRFSRTQSSGWGSAETGGAWTLSGSASSFAVANGTGQITLKAGSSPSAYLTGVSKADVNVVATTSLSQLANGGGAYSFLAARRSTDGTSLYRLKTWVNASGAVQLIITKVVNGTETTLRSTVVSGLTYSPGDQLRSRFVVTGSGTATLTGKVWKVGSAEPANAQASVTDGSALGAGGVGVTAYLSASSTSAPAALSVDDFAATAP